MNTGGGGLLSSPNRDVLEAAVPEDAAGRARLLEELRNRGRAAVAAGQWGEAERLYSRALLAATRDDGDGDDSARQQQQQRAILHANLSLCWGKMNQWGPALTEAERAVGADESYVKAWWRLGQAQAAAHRYGEAASSLEEALKRDPTSKALQKELAKMRELGGSTAAEREKNEEVGDKADERTTTAATGTLPPPVHKPAPKTTTTSPKKKKEEAASTSMEVDDDEDETTLFTKSEPVRGYKIVNGKKTSYFHTELSEEAKQLIGDTAPKKLDSSAAAAPAPTTTADAPAAASSSTMDTAASAWNKAGTWEERDVTAAAVGSLRDALKAVAYTLPPSSPAPGAVVSVERAACATGHASVATVRGKKRYIYEFDFTIHWKFLHERADDEDVEAAGSMRFPDVDGTCVLGEGYDMTDFTVTTADPAIRPVLDAFVKNQGFREALHEGIDDWVRQFRDTY